MRFKFQLYIFSCVAGAFIATVAGVAVSWARSDRIFPGVTIAHNNVAGLTMAEAEARVGEWARSQTANQITLSYGNRRWNAELRYLGVHAKVQSAVERAYAVGREESFFRTVTASLGIWTPDISVEFKADPKALDPVIAKIAKEINIPSRDARMQVVGGKFKIEPETPGSRLDEAKLKKAVLAAVESGTASVDLVINTDMPQVCEKDLQTIDSVLAKYTTSYPAWRRDRTHNIKIAAQEIDGTVLMPGQVFSYNDVVGPRLKERGYRDAPIFENGMLVPGIGGGVCQVSSTLYNAALLANLEIVKRSHHSSEVSYVPKGRDATVAYGLLDLKFRNSTLAPLYITSTTAGNKLTVALYGSGKYRTDVTIDVVRAKSSPGKTTVLVYRTVKENGEKVVRQLVSKDTYRPVKVAEAKLKPQVGSQTESSGSTVESALGHTSLDRG